MYAAIVFGAVLGTLLAIVSGLYFWYLSSEAKANVQKAPKDEMFICDTHGPIAKRFLININTDEMEWEYEGKTTTGEVPYCPLCFEDRVKQAKEKYR